MDQIISAIEALNNSDSKIRAQAKAYLITLGEKAIEPLITAMLSDTKYQSWEAASVLAKIGDARCILPFEQAAQSSNVLLGQMAVAGLERLHASTALLNALPSATPVVQTHIIKALENLKAHEAIHPLIQLLASTPHTHVRYQIIHALGQLKAYEAVDLIRSFSDDEDHHVRDYVQKTLKALNVSV